MFDLESLKKYRLENHITQEELANALGISPSYISKVENPNREIIPSLKNIIKICGKLDICPSLTMNCNCINCSLNIDKRERLECKKKTLNVLELYINASKELVEFELNNFDELLESELSYGDISYLRRVKKL